ncbi:MAG TPA: hypothetical protein VMU85_22435 [Stellaceae bacterium]|nr:hypothetical protein [Stellaceae bacterium]
MRMLPLLVLVVPLALAACGGDEHKTVVVNPPPNSTVVVPPNGQPQVQPACPPNTAC